MTIAGATKNSDGTWNTTNIVNPYGKAGSGSNSGSGNGNGSGNSASRVAETKAVYMSGNDKGPVLAGTSNGIPVDSDGNRVDTGLPVTFNHNSVTNKLEVCYGKQPIAVYDITSGELDDMTDISNITEKTGISHRAFKRTKTGTRRWDKHDEKLLKNLCRTAVNTVARSGGDYSVLNNYDAKFRSDTDNFDLWGDDNGSIYFGPAERAMPTNNDFQIPVIGGTFTEY